MSTNELDKKQALKTATKFYQNMIVNGATTGTKSSASFRTVAANFVKWQASQVSLGKLGKRTHQEDIYKLNRDILAFFGPDNISEITKSRINAYLASIADKKLSKSTLNKHVMVIRKVLNYAFDERQLSNLPNFPSIGTDNKARAYFNLEDYHQIVSVSQIYADEGRVVDYHVKGRVVRKLRFSHDLADFIPFHANSFLRTSDLKDLKHKHVKVCRPKHADDADDAVYLELFPPHPKTSDRSSLTMERAVEIYERLLKRHKRQALGGPDDYVFLPQNRNRTYALQVIRRTFNALLHDLNLKYDERGRARTVYSLRHTALMFRFLYGDNINIFDLARNALTSVEMLEKFYLSHAQSHMKIKELQSFKNNRKAYRIAPTLKAYRKAFKDKPKPNLKGTW